MTNTIANTYNEIAVVWIEDLERQPSSTLYKKLIPHYKPVYNGEDRFIFYNFSPVQRSTLDHVVNVLQYIDISPYFVSVITNQSETQEYFESLVEPIRVVQQAQGNKHDTIETARPMFNNNNHMCAHAWSGIHVYPDGTTKPCCEFSGYLKDNNNQDFNIRQHTIKEIVNSKHMNSLREEFRQGKVPSGCAKCASIEQVGGVSKRQLTRFKLQNIWGHIDWESDSDHNIGFVGGHLGNLCNLKCRICSEEFSSSIATEKLANNSEDYKNSPVYLTLINNNWKKYREIFFDQIKSIPQLRNFEFLGGEPLMIKENLEFMQYLIDNNLSKDCIFEFVTNGTQYHDVFDRANQFHRLTITMSIDDIGQRFEYQRSGATWGQLQNNLKKFMSNTGLTMGVSITVNVQNVLYLPELIQWLLSQGIDDYAYNILQHPSWMCISRLTPQAKQLIINRLTNSGLPEIHQQRLNFVLGVVKNSFLKSDGQDFVKNIKLVDNIRGENFTLAHPEIADAMGVN